MIQFPISTGPKEDHPQRVAKLIGVDPKYYYKADELKLYEDAINELANRTSGATSAENELIEKGFHHIIDFNWYVFAQKYKWLGVLFEKPEDLVIDTITIDPAPTTENFKRFDVPVFNIDKTFSIIKGDEGLNPAIPKIDPRTQILLTVILVEYGTTSPSYLTKQIMYDEGLGLPAEFAVTKTGDSITIGNLEQPSSGLNCIKVANPTNADVLFLDKNVTFNSLDADTISFKVKNDIAGNWKFYLYSYNSIEGFYQGTTTIENGRYGYDSNNITDHQIIIVPISAILGSSEIHNTGFALTFFNNAGGTFYFDEFSLNGGFTQAPVNSGITEAPIDNDYYVRRNAGWFNIATWIGLWNTASNWITTNGQNILDFIANANKKPIVSAIWKELLKFDVKASQFPAGDNWYEATPNEVTLVAADDLLDRIDLIGAFAPVSPATLGLVGKITGDPASTELVVPPDYDPETFFPIKQVIVKAGSTTPTDGNGNTMSTVIAYANGTGEPDEWTFNSNNASIVNAAGVINATNPSSSHVATLMNNADVAGLDSLKEFSLSFDLTLKANLGSSYIFVKLLGANGVQMISPLLFRNGKFGLNSSSLATQNIVITGDNFSFITLGSFRGIQIYPFKSFAGYTLDNIKFHVGSAVIPVPSSHTHRDFNFLESLTQAMFDAKVDKVVGKELSDENYTLAEKTKLASLETPHFKGLHVSEAALNIAHPTAISGDFADVDAGVGADVARWIWDVSDTQWVVQSGTIAGETSASIKAKYEANADTNAFTDALLAKLNSITAIFTTALKTLYDTAYTHSQSAHAPTNAQKNSDITTAEVEAKRLKTRITNATVTGTYTLNHALGNDWKLTLTGITTIDESNLPTGTDTLEFTMKVTGNFGLTVPAYWNVLGDAYDGTIWNFFTIQIHKGDATQEATCFLSNF